MSSQTSTLDPAPLTFRPLAVADLPLLHRWFNAPHARTWFGGGRTQAEVDAQYVPTIEGREPIHAFIVSYDGAPIGMMEWVRFGDHPDVMVGYEVDDPAFVNCDVLIGEPDFVHRGLGAPLVLRFLREIVFADRPFGTCVIDPWQTNINAIRAYAKAGFRYVRTVIDPEDGKTPLYLMQLP